MCRSVPQITCVPLSVPIVACGQVSVPSITCGGPSVVDGCPSTPGGCFDPADPGRVIVDPGRVPDPGRVVVDPGRVTPGGVGGPGIPRVFRPLADGDDTEEMSDQFEEPEVPEEGYFEYDDSWFDAD